MQHDENTHINSCEYGSTEEMNKIAETLEAEFFFGFAFKDGTKI